jgi:monoamine oxidase
MAGPQEVQQPGSVDHGVGRDGAGHGPNVPSGPRTAATVAGAGGVSSEYGSVRMAEPIVADVCVVGAGFAGLTTAFRLHQRGMTTVVLEARDRVGGRVWTQALSDGSPVDRGGAWLAPYHDAIFGLTRELGISTYKTWVEGSHLLVDGGRILPYKGLIPKISPLAVLSIALTQARLDRASKRIPLDAPWTAKRAGEWDARTVKQWLDASTIRTSVGRDLFEMAVRGLFTGDLNDTSYLHLLFLVRAHGSINALFSIEGGSQENMVEGGAGSIARRMADVLGDAVHLNAAVRSITQGGDRVLVATDDVEVAASHVVIAVPPALVLEIAFDPGLPPDRQALYAAAVAGPESKTLLVYDEPFWRGDGRSGQSAGPNSAAEVTLDATGASGSPGVLASFTFGSVAERMGSMDKGERRQAVLDALVGRFGAKAGTPAEFIETAWWDEPWTRGCSMAHFPPGLLTRYGSLLREPFGRVHWAGTETSTKSHGAIDGAVLSGERATNEIVAGT